MPSGLRCCETYTNVDKSATERAKLSVSAWILHTKNVMARLRAAHLKPLLKPEYDFRTVTSTKKSFCINNASKLHPLAHRTNSKAGTAASYQLSALEKCSVEKKKMEQFLETVSWSSVIQNACACSCLPEDRGKHGMERGGERWQRGKRESSHKPTKRRRGELENDAE